MKYAFIFFCLLIVYRADASEWTSLKQYQQETGFKELSSKDWLKSDRRKNTLRWQKANIYNLKNQNPHEYQSISQRRDFYEWYYKSLEAKDCQVIWPKMAHFISKKLRLTKAFPFNIFTSKNLKEYAYQGSETVFDSAFEFMEQLYDSEGVFDAEKAYEWDKMMLEKEQHYWLKGIYNTVDDKTLKTITKMAKGKCLYAILVPKEIRFKGDIENADTRYQYALDSLRPYCKEHYKIN